MKWPIPVLILGLLSCSATFSTFNTGQKVTHSSISQEFRDEMLSEVNALRAKGCQCGNKWMPAAPPLRWNNKLEASAKRHVNDMYAHRFMSHDGSDGSEFSERITQAGYKWSAVAENVAWGYGSVREVVEGWVESPGHCRSMMDRTYTEIGAAFKGAFWAQDFGRPW